MAKVAKFLSFLLLPVLILIAAAPTPRSAPNAEYPRSMAALGDSITRGYSACCVHGDYPARSWSTGDGPSDGVASHYERLLQLAPGIRGKNTNNAVSGAKAADLPRQAAAAAEQGAEYVTVLVGANDLCTASLDTMTPVEDFRASVTRALATLDQMRPRPQVFVSSIPDMYQLWNVLRLDQAAQSAWSAGRICQSMLAASNTEDMRRQVVQRELAFNEVLAATCARYESCRTDGGAVYAHGFSASDVSVLDYFHPSLQGQATLADITWQAAWQRNQQSVLAVVVPLPCAQQFDFRPSGHKAFDGVEHLHEVGAVSCHQAGAHLRAPVLVVVTHLSHGHVILALDVSQQWPDNRAFLLQALNVAQEDVEFDPADPHGFSLAKYGCEARW